jgi:hypothetical protein
MSDKYKGKQQISRIKIQQKYHITTGNSSKKNFTSFLLNASCRSFNSRDHWLVATSYKSKDFNSETFPFREPKHLNFTEI